MHGNALTRLFQGALLQNFAFYLHFSDFDGLNFVIFAKTFRFSQNSEKKSKLEQIKTKSSFEKKFKNAEVNLKKSEGLRPSLFYMSKLKFSTFSKT